jgi:hypothetical protein
MKTFKLLAAAAALSVSSASFAMPTLITEWDFINEAGWMNWDPATDVTASAADSDGGNGSILSTGALSTQICWGDPVVVGQQSCLEVDSPITEGTTQVWDENGVYQDVNGGAAQGRVQTVAAFGDYTTAFKNGTALRHDNFKLWADTSTPIESVTLVDGLQLTGFYNMGANNTGAVLAPELQFAVDFNETRNDGGNDGICEDGNAVGVGVNVNGCADIFSVIGFVGGNIIGGGADFIDFAVEFVVNGVGPGIHKRYELITRLSGLQTLGGGAFGFLTEEERVNVLNAQFAVRAVPEPSTLAVFALSLVGLVLVGRRKKA